MRHLITVAALLAAFIAPSVASAFHNGEQVIDGFRLPQNHRFESPDAKGGGAGACCGWSPAS